MGSMTCKRCAEYTRQGDIAGLQAEQSRHALISALWLVVTVVAAFVAALVVTGVLL